MAKIRVNERGLRIGESHPGAKLLDAEVEQLLKDREGGMSLGALAKKWGLSKSGVKGIVDGNRRGQIGPSVEKAPSRRRQAKKVRVNVRIPLHLRAKFHRLGGGVWLAQALELANDAHR
jgi:hypothetical protein